MRRLIICLFIILFVFTLAGAQGNNPYGHFLPPAFSAPPHPFFKKDTSGIRITPPSFISYPINAIAASYYITRLGFFCKKEIQVQKITQLPLKFRLGSVAYTDMLEGKFAGKRK